MSVGNIAANAAADLAIREKEKNDLMRGKTYEQQQAIQFFYGSGSSGCLGRGGEKGLTVQQYQERVKAKLQNLDTKAMALKKLGIDEEEVQEVEPVSFAGYVYNDKKDNLVARTSNNSWVSSDYMITWLFFGERELFVYQYSFSMISDSKCENTMQYFYNDITSFVASSDTYQKWIVESTGGCKGGAERRQVSADSDEFRIIVPGDKLRCSMVPSETTDAAIRGMRNKLREMKCR